MSKKKKQKEKQQKKSFREQKLPGWMEDAEVLDIHRKAPMIRTISEVVYSQIIGKREARQLRMDDRSDSGHRRRETRGALLPGRRLAGCR